MNSTLINSRIADITPDNLSRDLGAYGCVLLPALLSAEECISISELYPSERPFRSHIHMARHGFGKGEYKYFAYPLPNLISTLHQKMYPLLVPIANAWNERMGIETRFPIEHGEYLDLCGLVAWIKLPAKLVLSQLFMSHVRTGLCQAQSCGSMPLRRRVFR